MLKLILLGLLASVAWVACDLPTNCMYEDTLGKWTLSIGAENQTSAVDCNEFTPVRKLVIELLFPNTAVDENGNVGTWTMIYNQGFEIRLNRRSYFAFQFVEQWGKKVESHCHQTFNGWVYDAPADKQFPPQNWGCYSAEQLGPSKIHTYIEPEEEKQNLDEKYGLQQELVDEINSQNLQWKAGVYEEYANFTLRDMISRAGGKKHLTVPKSKTVLGSEELPQAFDWRSKDYVSAVRNQGKCGSCYAFASMAQLESQARIETNGRIQPVFSTQDIVSCSPLSQGCSGGFPYLVAGRYAQSYGVITEDCYPYTGKDSECHRKSQGFPLFTSDYGYVGGFFGACSETMMKVALIKYGPLSVGINVTAEFLQYKGGIFYQPKANSNDKFNPFELTNHAVLLVGYGVDHDSGVPFWTVKNSWGTAWGERGFFRIRRGTDELAIESMAVYAKLFFGH